MKQPNRIESRIQRLKANNTSNKALKNRNIRHLIPLLILCLISLYAFTDFIKGEKSTISVAADFMNILYLEVPNPITVAVAAIPAHEIELESSDVELQNQGNGHYVAMAKKTGNAVIHVSGDGIENQVFTFRVERFPDVVAVLDHPSILNSANGNIPSKLFWETNGLTINSRDLEYQLDFEILGYSLIKVPGRGEAVEIKNEGAALNGAAKKLVQSAEFGDVFYFENIVVNVSHDSQKEYFTWILEKPTHIIFKMNQ